ncbi:MAG: hypothetical protein H7240_02265 [Glaciimonas sp.]|nr:hypothetical protein [Glaciimonas sp.]
MGILIRRYGQLFVLGFIAWFSSLPLAQTDAQAQVQTLNLRLFSAEERQ